MLQQVTPKTYRIASTRISPAGLTAYLRDTDNLEFAREVDRDGPSDMATLASFAAKVCYNSLSMGKNKNITRIRSIPNNVAAILRSAHGSVLEHASFTFVTTNCSRVFTHELVRHRAGTAFSQESGRYVTSELDYILDPIVSQLGEHFEECMKDISRAYFKLRMMLGLYTDEELEMAKATMTKQDCEKIPKKVTDFDHKKKLTSALRRILPDGRANAIVWSANVRALRHMLQMRTSPAAEWEIRKVFGDVWNIVCGVCPELFADAKVTMVDGLPHIHSMKAQPYDQTPSE